MGIELLAALGGALAAIGGFELVKYLLNLRANRRAEESRARAEDAAADGGEFNVLRDTNIFLQEQLRDKEKRFAEQNADVRQLNKENIAKERRIGELEVENALHRCELDDCPWRRPPTHATPQMPAQERDQWMREHQSPYLYCEAADCPHRLCGHPRAMAEHDENGQDNTKGNEDTD